jgi:hypothetical protein
MNPFKVSSLPKALGFPENLICTLPYQVLGHFGTFLASELGLKMAENGLSLDRDFVGTFRELFEPVFGFTRCVAIKMAF